MSLIIIRVAHTVKDVLFFIAVISISFSVFYIIKGRLDKYVGHILMFLNLSSIIAYNIFLAPGLTFDISASIMLLAIKFYYLGKEHNHKKSFKSYATYVFLVPGLLTGPVPSYKEFCSQKRSTKLNNGIRKIVESLFYLFIYSSLRKNFEPSTILLQSHILKRIIMLLMYTTLNRAKYYFAWTYAHGNFMFMGYNYQNVVPLSCEFASSFKKLQSSWNIYTNAWLKNSVFIPLKRIGYYKASLCTFFISALWHGTNTCYFFMFITISLCVPLLKNNEILIQKYLEKRIAYIVRIIHISFFVSYFTVPFFLLDMNLTYILWKSLFFYGHVFVVFSLLNCLIFKKRKKFCETQSK